MTRIPFALLAAAEASDLAEQLPDIEEKLLLDDANRHLRDRALSLSVALLTSGYKFCALELLRIVGEI